MNSLIFNNEIRQLPRCLLIGLFCYWLMQPALIYARGPNSTQEESSVTVEIRYRLPEAGEVYLVWGINGWVIVPEATRPTGTAVKDKLMYTPMIREGNIFVAKVQVPSGVTIDYAFQITRIRSGDKVDIWDTNGAPKRDYHTIATPGRIVEIQGTLPPPKSKKSLMDLPVGLQLLFGILIIYGIHTILTRTRRIHSQKVLASTALKIMCTGASLLLFLLILRARMMGFGWISFRSSLILGLDVLSSGYYDFVYVIAVTFLFVSITLLIQKHQKAQGVLYFAYVGIALLSLLIAFINMKVVPMLGKPFTYQWLYYSDFLRNFDTKNAILSNVSWKLFWNAVALSAAMIISSGLLVNCMNLLQKRRLSWLMTFTLIGTLFVYMPIGYLYIDKRGWDRSKLLNPVMCFLQSIVNSRAYPALFTMTLPANVEEFRGAADDYSKGLPIKGQKNGHIRNVLIFVLESVPTEYLEAYGGRYPVTPELNKYLQHSALFENIYAHAPATNKALVPILCSIYPWISYRSLTQDYPTINLPSLSKELKKHGYSTAFFNAGDNRFQGTQMFLSDHEFGTLQDHRSLNCQRQRFAGSTEEWPFLDGVDDECVVDSFTEWISDPSRRPFFALLWTYMTHYPYFVVGEEVDFGVGSKQFNRYLNSLRHIDKVFGKLLRQLKKRNLLDSTLIAVVGDHGEAFGQHEQFVHASKIYEENLHVPLILINPRLFKGGKYPVVGGLVDLAPTIMDILNLQVPGEWQGQSLFSDHRNNRVYFFAPWSNFLFGYREGNLKFIFDATNSTYEVYDLLKDPKETTNVVNRFPNLVSESQLRLAAWVQYHNKFINARIANSPSSR